MGGHEEPLPGPLPPAPGSRPWCAAGAGAAPPEARGRLSAPPRSGGPVREPAERHRGPRGQAGGRPGGAAGPAEAGHGQARRHRRAEAPVPAEERHTQVPRRAAADPPARCTPPGPSPQRPTGSARGSAVGCGPPGAVVPTAPLPPCARALPGRPGASRPDAPPL